ncbi:MAG: hypothetical protein WDA07_14730 [Leucobacter sp.]
MLLDDEFRPVRYFGRLLRSHKTQEEHQRIYKLIVLIIHAARSRPYLELRANQ